jgi:hypothetical protein
MKKATEEDRVAKRLAKLVNDVSLDLDEVGIALSYSAPTVTINRLSTVIESAIWEREGRNNDFE